MMKWFKSNLDMGGRDERLSKILQLTPKLTFSERNHEGLKKNQGTSQKVIIEQCSWWNKKCQPFQNNPQEWNKAIRGTKGSALRQNSKRVSGKPPAPNTFSPISFKSCVLLHTDRNPLTCFLRCYGGEGLEREAGGEQLRLAGPPGHSTGTQITDVSKKPM